MNVQVEGIVLRGVDYGETHRIVTLLTPEIGKVGAMARGAKRPQSRLRALVQPLVRGTFSLAYRGQGMAIIRQGQWLEGYRAIQEDLWKHAYAGYAAELVDRFVEEATPGPKVYEFFRQWLESLAAGKDAEILTRLFELHVCEWAGVRPVLDRCAGCGAAVGYARMFDLSGGGPLCDRCLDLRRGIPIRPQTYAVMRALQSVPVNRLGDIRVGPDTRRELADLVGAYLEHHTGARLRGREYIRRLREYAWPGPLDGAGGDLV